MPQVLDCARQALLALVWYAVMMGVLRLAGKRLAGQTTTFDLLVLITLGVVLQKPTLEDGKAQAIVFFSTVFLSHLGQTAACARWTWLRHLLRGKPAALVRGGVVLETTLRDERISHEELLAGLRKLGFDSPEAVELAVLEETGHISAVGRGKT